MDLEQLIPLIVIVLGLIFSVFRRKKQSEQDTKTANEADVQPDGEFGIPPFLEIEEPTEEAMVLQDNVVPATAEQSVLEIEDVVPVMAEQSVPESEPVVETPTEPAEAEPPPVPPELRGRRAAGTRQFPTTSLIDVSPETFRQGIILSEILGKPKTFRRRK